MTHVGVPLAAGTSTVAGNFGSSVGKMIQLLKEFLAYALLTVFKITVYVNITS